MPPLAQHLMLRLRDDRALTPTVEARRALARLVLGLGQETGLLAFREADTHAHLLTVLGGAEAARLARRIELSWVRGQRLPMGFSSAHLRPIGDQRHLCKPSGTCSRRIATTTSGTIPTTRRAVSPISWACARSASGPLPW